MAQSQIRLGCLYCPEGGRYENRCKLLAVCRLRLFNGVCRIPGYDKRIFGSRTRFLAPKGQHGLSLGFQPQEPSASEWKPVPSKTIQDPSCSTGKIPLAILKYNDNASTIVCRESVELDDIHYAGSLMMISAESVRLVEDGQASALISDKNL
jgi:hypothetical protein